MANTGSVGAVRPFGAESETKEVGAIVEADPLSAFLTDVAPLVVGILVIGAFLAYQFGRWYLARPRGPVIEVENLSAGKPTKIVEAVAEPGEAAADRMQRPWQTQ